MMKLGARDRAHLVVFAYEAGLVRPGGWLDTAIAVAQVPAPGRRREPGGLDTLTAGKAFVGDVELDRLSDRQLTLLRRDRIGFVFQAFNLVPTLSARDNITLPMTLAAPRPTRTGWPR